MQDAADRICGTHFDAFIVYEPDQLDPRVEWGAAEEDPEVQYWRDGEVFGVVIAPSDTENAWNDQRDSCYGFYGWDWARENAVDMLNHAEREYVTNGEWVTI
jgi:hypothetical protein